MATFYTESQRENWSNIFRFSWLTFRKKSSSFYGTPWGRGILVSMSSLRERTELRNRKAGEGPRKNFCYWGCFRGLHFWAPTTEKNVRLKPWHINNYTNAKGFKNQLRDKKWQWNRHKPAVYCQEKLNYSNMIKCEESLSCEY